MDKCTEEPWPIITTVGGVFKTTLMKPDTRGALQDTHGGGPLLAVSDNHDGGPLLAVLPNGGEQEEDTL